MSSFCKPEEIFTKAVIVVTPYTKLGNFLRFNRGGSPMSSMQSENRT